MFNINLGAMKEDTSLQQIQFVTCHYKLCSCETSILEKAAYSSRGHPRLGCVSWNVCGESFAATRTIIPRIMFVPSATTPLRLCLCHKPRGRTICEFCYVRTTDAGHVPRVPISKRTHGDCSPKSRWNTCLLEAQQCICHQKRSAR